MTVVTDNFNRANGALGANWTEITAADAAPTISSNTAIGGTGLSTWGDGSLWTANSFTNDQYAEFDATYAAVGDVEVLLRGNVAGTQGYLLVWNGTDVSILELPGLGTLDTDAGNPTSGTHNLRFEAEGTALRGYVDNVQVVSTTDATWTSGSPGIIFYRGTAGTGGSIDNFEAGNLIALTATTFDDDRIDLAWNTVSGATGYDIERDGTVIVSNHGSTSYSDTGLTPSTLYSYRVRAVL